MTRKIGTCPTYAVPQAWAAAFFAGGNHTGIRYQTRFNTGSKADAAALFDQAGQRDWPTDSAPLPGVQACADAGIIVAHRPTRRQVRITQPPHP